jgi:ABC-type ATPase with predicted acetyltransferase domain
MYTLNVKTTLDWNPTFSDRMTELMQMFGLRMTRLKERRLHHACRLNLKPGQICYITGSSGAGKSVLLNALYEQIKPAERIRLDTIPLEDDASLIDCMEGDVWNATGILSKAGFSDLFSMLSPPAVLSTGQQWRYRLAKAIAAGRQWIFADDFSASLDRIIAGVIAHNLRKLAGKTDKIFILASCHEDMLVDLQPDVIVIKYLNGTLRTIYKDRSQADDW